MLLLFSFSSIPFLWIINAIIIGCINKKIEAQSEKNVYKRILNGYLRINIT